MKLTKIGVTGFASRRFLKFRSKMLSASQNKRIVWFSQGCFNTTLRDEAGGGGHSHIGSHYGCAVRMGEFSRPKILQMGVSFCPKTCRWIIILRHKTSRLVTISIIPPGNGWFSCKLNKTYCNLANFASCFIVHSLEMGMFLFINGPALVCGWVSFPGGSVLTNLGRGACPSV